MPDVNAPAKHEAPYRHRSSRTLRDWTGIRLSKSILELYVAWRELHPAPAGEPACRSARLAAFLRPGEVWQQVKESWHSRAALSLLVHSQI